jgi:putative hydrolase of HD superfamily
MNINDYTDEVILSDLTKLQYLYGLKRVIRYNLEREAADATESVAEHVYGMQLLTQYFLALEDTEGKADRTRIYEMVTAHDLDEVETGDVLGYAKTDAIRALEKDAMLRVIAKAPNIIQPLLTARVEEYEAKETYEAQFARAIDKIEPLVQMYNDVGRAVFTRNKTTEEQSWRIKEQYIAPFPFIKRFAEVVHDTMVKEGYFYEG